MNAKELIRQVNDEMNNNWQNSDISKANEELLEQIVGHYEVCKECQEAFDDMNYAEDTIIEFSRRLDYNPESKDWICCN